MRAATQATVQIRSGIRKRSSLAARSAGVASRDRRPTLSGLRLRLVASNRAGLDQTHYQSECVLRRAASTYSRSSFTSEWTSNGRHSHETVTSPTGARSHHNSVTKMFSSDRDESGSTESTPRSSRTSTRTKWPSSCSPASASRSGSFGEDSHVSLSVTGPRIASMRISRPTEYAIA